MSIRAMNWVWSLDLRPVSKLILLALADAADHEGICWPSIPTIAGLAQVSIRTVQREMDSFRSQGLLESEPRFRKDGSRTSNRYRLSIEIGGDKLSPPSSTGDTTGRQYMPPGDDTPVTVTTSESSSIQQPQPLGASTLQNALSTDSSGCGGDSLIFPEKLTSAELDACRRLVAEIEDVSAQLLLDELQGRLAVGGIRSSPIAYLRTLASRFRRGEFQPELALQVSENRRRKQEADAGLSLARASPASVSSRVASQRDPDVIRNRMKALRNAINGKSELSTKSGEKEDD